MKGQILAFSIWVISAATDCTADPGVSNSPTNDVLLLDNLGRIVQVPTNGLPAGILPPSHLGLKHQTPVPVEGAKLPDEVQQRLQEGREGDDQFQFVPIHQPPLAPYLASLDAFGDTALQPGALTPFVLLEELVQSGKYALSAVGLRYSLQQTFTYVGMSDVMKGADSLGYYTFNLKAKWAMFDAPGAGTSGGISAQIQAKSGLGSPGATQDAQSNLGTLTDPNGIWSSVNGFRVPELAWQESLRDGEIVVLAGMISQRNYLDGNAYAHTGRGKFMNSALIHSEVMPLSQYNFGMNLQWQPKDDWYAMLGASAGNAPAGETPWTDFSWNQWSVVGEIGYAPDDFLGLGPGVYRIQPFVAEKGGPTQAGLCFNLQQRLGPHSPFAWFGRFGFGGSQVSADADKQIGTGFVMQAPLKYAGLIPKLSNDLLGVGFVWSQPSATTKTVYHENEYILETFYALQLTPTMKLQPDFQIVWNPTFNPESGPALVGQIQLVLAW